ncbi:MAG: hypothetical protein JKY27_09110 [Magnetovibrio sp.]|nr:hypothetical protein [Magnetovibrio sp.]
MKVGRHTPELNFEVEHVGFDMTFYHPRGDRLQVDFEVIEAFEAEREHAEIFIQHGTGTPFSADELLNWFLLQTGTTLADHLPAKALKKGEGVVHLTIPIRFEKSTFHMLTEDGEQDLSALKLMTKISINKRSLH